MKKRIINEQEAIQLLKKQFKHEKDFDNVLKHSLAVKKVAIKIAKQVGADVEFVKIAAILHDIGRSVCPPKTKASIRHGVEGAKILRKEKLNKFANIAERHLGCGINKKDIKDQNLPLPMKCYVPLTKEEKVLAYSDNLIFGTKLKTIKDVIERFDKEIGQSAVKKIVSVHNQLVELGMKKKKLKPMK